MPSCTWRIRPAARCPPCCSAPWLALVPLPTMAQAGAELPVAIREQQQRRLENSRPDDEPLVDDLAPLPPDSVSLPGPPCRLSEPSPSSSTSSSARASRVSLPDVPERVSQPGAPLVIDMGLPLQPDRALAFRGLRTRSAARLLQARINKKRIDSWRISPDPSPGPRDAGGNPGRAAGLRPIPGASRCLRHGSIRRGLRQHRATRGTISPARLRRLESSSWQKMKKTIRASWSA